MQPRGQYLLGTLLNRLFGTDFDVMSENARMQTTKGIWISKGRDMKVLVMDVEGTDGRERGEDQVNTKRGSKTDSSGNFRKAMLFTLLPSIFLRFCNS